jgi:hypothetical protein
MSLYNNFTPTSVIYDNPVAMHQQSPEILQLCNPQTFEPNKFACPTMLSQTMLKIALYGKLNLRLQKP